MFIKLLNAHMQGQKIMTKDYDCYRDHSKLKVIERKQDTKTLIQQVTGA